MKVVANDMIVKQTFKDKYEAVSELKKSIEILKILKKSTKFEKLSSEQGIFRNWEIAPGFFIEQLFNDRSGMLGRNEKLLLLTMLTNFNPIQVGEDEFHTGMFASKQCAYAYYNQALVFSIPVDDRWKTERLEGKLIIAEKAMEVDIGNISQIEHLKIYGRQLQMWKYEFNPKHAVQYGWGTVMDLSDEDAQELLLQAIAVDNTYKHLIAKKNRRYYSFRCHHENCYHGYYDDTMRENYKTMVDKVFDKIVD